MQEPKSVQKPLPKRLQRFRSTAVPSAFWMTRLFTMSVKPPTPPHFRRTMTPQTTIVT